MSTDLLVWTLRCWRDACVRTHGTRRHAELPSIEAAIYAKAVASLAGKACQDRLTPSDIICDLSQFDFGAKDKNPVDSMRFFTKANVDSAVKIGKDMVSTLLPPQYQEQELRVFCKHTGIDTIKAVSGAFASWCVGASCQKPLSENMAILATPRKGGGGGGSADAKTIPFALPEE